MKSLMKKKHSKFVAVTGALVLALGLAAPAYATDNTADCNAAVEKANQALLKANVSSEKLTEIFNLIDKARASCVSEAFAEADASLAAAAEQIKAATAN